MDSYWANEQKNIIAVPTEERFIYMTIPEAGNPLCIGEHVPLEYREAGKNPRPYEEWKEYTSNLPKPEPKELTPEERLANAGLTVDQLKELLGI
jgi:hypothetical protein